MDLIVPLHDSLISAFRVSVLSTHRSRFVQFIYFHLISLSPTFWYAPPSNISDEFLGLLVETTFNESEPPHSRLACLSYLSSLSARAVFLPNNTISSLVSILTAYCLRSTKRDAIWFGAYQATVYIVTTRWRDLELKGLNEPVVGMARKCG